MNTSSFTEEKILMDTSRCTPYPQMERPLPKWQNEFDTQQNAWNDLVRVDKEYDRAYLSGSGDDGYIQTFDIGTSDNAGPAITANSINYENSQFTIMLDEAAYNTNEGSGDLEVTDFTLSITGGAATLSSATPTSISKIGDSQHVLGFSLSGTANGSEVLKAVPVQNAVYDITVLHLLQSNQQHGESL